jgi:N-acetylglutamate synthase-like GNAT family acetyltransferase
MMKTTKAELHIRAAKRKEAEVVSSILYEAFIDFKPLYTNEAFNATAITPQQVLNRMDEGLILLAIVGNEAVGTVSTVVKQEGYYIRGMAVLPKSRGKNIGWGLLESIETHARESGLDRMFLCTTPFLSSAINLYSCFGFKRISDKYDDFFGTNICSMEKLL